MGFAFKLDVTGNLATELEPINRGLDQTVENLNEARGAMSRFDQSMSAVVKQSGILATVDLVGAFRAVAGAIGTAIDKTIELGRWFVRVAADQQDLQLAMRLQLGDEGAAQLERLSQSFGNTRFDDDLVKRALLPLAEAGIKDAATLDNIATAAADISARFGSGNEGFERAVGALGKIALQRSVEKEQLAQLGIVQGEFRDSLAQTLGVSVDEVKKLVEGGKVAAPTLLAVALQSIADKHGGALGEAALAGGRTLGASLDRLANLPANMFKVLGDSPALKGIQNVIDGIVEAFTGPQGQRLVAAIGRGLDSLLGDITKEPIAETIEDVIDTVFTLIGAARDLASGLATVWNVASALWARVVDLGDLLGFLAAEGFLAVTWTLETIASIGGKAVAVLQSFSGNFFDAAAGLGQSIIDGLIGGVQESFAAVGRIMDKVAEHAIGTFRKTLEIFSPSGVFEDAGRHITEGLVGGIERGVPEVVAAQRALADAAAPGALGAAGAPGLLGAAAGVSISAPIEITVNAGSGDDADDIAERTAEAAQRAVLTVLQRAALAYGA